ncbi:MAG: restriction endonuclease [Mangrovibacterium sp.]
MSWRKYEKDILKYFQETYPEANILFDQKIQGKYSKVSRQIDILIEGEIAGYQIRIVVDCKYFSKKIDVKHVESFCSMVEDVEAHQGVLITQKGFSKAGINRAHYGIQKVELDIINFDELKEFQSFAAFPYIDHFSVIVPAPFGWVLDLVDKINSFASLHQRGLTLKEAQKRNEWMYMQFWVKEGTNDNIESLIEIQNKNILQIDSKSKFTYNNHVKRTDGYPTKIRIAEISSYPAIEVTGFIEFEKHIFFIVLFTAKELLTKNLRKLQHILKVATPSEIKFDNTIVIKQCLETIEESKDNEEKADKYFQIGKWYKEMDDFESAFQSYVKGIECFPLHYTYLKKIIREALAQKLDNDALKYSIQLFDIEPKNPRVPQDLIEIYFDQNKQELLITFFKNSLEKYKQPEELGNLYFHLGLVYLNIGVKDKADYSIKKSKELFEVVLPKNHPVFKTIKEYEKE